MFPSQSQKGSHEFTFSSSWDPFTRSRSPFGINGLSPQSDDVVKEKEISTIQSPIGTEPSIINSPPAHILGIFSPSERSEGLLKALTLSPNNSEHELTDEDVNDNFNTNNNLSEYDDFLLGMGGMEDIGNMHDSYTAPRQKLYEPNTANTNIMHHHHHHQQQYSPLVSQNPYGYSNHLQQRYNKFDSQVPQSPPLYEPRDFTPRYESHTTTRNTSSSYDMQNNYFPSQQQQRHSPSSRPINKNLGYRGNHMHSSPPNFYNAGSPPTSNSSQSWGEHPFGEHPSRTLFVRNINSNVEESELKELFEVYGTIRSMYTLCKHRGFVMISYYDIRHAKTAMRSLQGKLLRRRKLDIHYSIPKDNPSEKDQNQGTLVVFNLDPSISKEELKEIFGVHGEIKEIRETPNKRHHKFIEFYDVRCAEQAMKVLNKTEIKSKKIKIEPSRPGGRKANLHSTRDDNLLHSDNYLSEYPVSKSAPSHPHHNTNSFNTGETHRRRSNVTVHSPPMQSQPNWSNTHRNLRSISLPPGSNASTHKPLSPNISERRSRQEDVRQFTLNIQAVQQGSDRRTTLMIKNIPNKYTQKMLLASVDATHKGQYDFFYLPIDFKNKCNVGYAFINFIDPQSIITFYQQLHNTKWDKFNSEKVCNIAYARIQGKESLIAHFQNSSLMSEDKKCRPIIFHSNGPKMGQQAPFPVGSNVRMRTKDEKRLFQKDDFRPSIPVKKTSRSRSYSCK